MNKTKTLGAFLMIAGLALIVIAFASATPASVLSGSSLVANGDFESSSTLSWYVYMSSGNTATLSLTQDAYDGDYAGLVEVTSYVSSDPLCLQNRFTPANGATHEATFAYKSTMSFNTLVISMLEGDKYYAFVSCPSSSTWTTISFLTDELSSSATTWIDFRFYSTGTLWLDDVSVVATSTPTPTPTPSPPPTNQWQIEAFTDSFPEVGTVLPRGIFNVDLGSTFTAQAFPAEGYVFSHWQYHARGVSPTDDWSVDNKLYGNPVTVGPEPTGTIMQLEAVFDDGVEPPPDGEVDWAMVVFGGLTSAVGGVIYSRGKKR